MSNYVLENDILTIIISSFGAELQSIYNKENKLEYLWQADPEFWAKKSPVLFPIVGGLKNNQYNYLGKNYSLNRHGFAREKEFNVIQVSSTIIQFVFESNDETLKVYPFHFKLTVEYSINNNQLFCSYFIENKGNDEMYFSIGAHPAFKVPLTESSSYEDWFLEFNKIEDAGIYPLTNEGLLEVNPIPFLKTTNQLQLKKELFYKDALVFKNLQSNKISIKGNSSKHGLTMQFYDFKYFGIWSAKNANFVCLEPWCGIADAEDTNSELTSKEGIHELKVNNNFKRTWSVEVF
ncbi:MAG: aldose 1-epimerase family protein [Chitinophagaceae bacterium]|nr:aldose 1-epimerase family protein [Chitinophagaceae bacterium]